MSGVCKAGQALKYCQGACCRRSGAGRRGKADRVCENDPVSHREARGPDRIEKAKEALFQWQKWKPSAGLTGGIAHNFNNLLAAISGSMEHIRSLHAVLSGRLSSFLELLQNKTVGSKDRRMKRVLSMTGNREHLHELIKDFQTGMLTTRSGDGGVHIRPMRVAKLESDQELLFATGLATPKVAEIEKINQVAVVFQSSSEFAVLYGTAHVLKDRALIDELWSEAWRIWFPGGKDDPNLCLLAVTPVSAEYWDSSGTEGLKYLYEGLKAIWQKRTPNSDDTQHGKVSL